MQTGQTDGFDYLAILRGMWRRHKRLAALVFLALAVPLLVLVYFTSRPLYEATATVMVDGGPVERLPYLREVGPDNPVTYELILRSRALSEAVLAALPQESIDELLAQPLYIDYGQAALNLLRRLVRLPVVEAPPQQRALAELRNGRMQFRTIEQDRSTSSSSRARLIAITAAATTPRVAMDIVNAHIQALLKLTRSSDQEDARRMRGFLEQQTEQARVQLVQAEQAVTRFQRQKGRVSLGSPTELEVAKLSQLEGALAEAQASRQFLAARAAALRGVLNPRNGTPGSPAERERAQVKTQMENFAKAQERLQQLESKLASLRERYTEAHPAVAMTRDEVAAEQARVARMARALPAAPTDSLVTYGDTPADRRDVQRQLLNIQAEDAGLQGRIQTLQAQLQRLRGGMQSLSQDDLQFGNLLRTVEAQRNLLAVFQDKLTAARIRDQATAGAVRIIDSASFPMQASHARTARLALLVLGLAGSVSLLLAFGVELWHQPVETETDVRKATGLPVLGSVGTLAPARMIRPRGPDDRHLPLNLGLTAPGLNVQTDLYRAIRASIETERIARDFRCVVVTSPGPAEGKSTTALNVAHVFQEFGRRVLLIDADLRRPALHRAVGVSNAPGLVDYLTTGASFEAIARPLSSGVVVIPSQAARQDAASLLASDRLKDLLAEARQRFDLVLVDSAPLLAVPDNLLMVTLVDRVILVVRASQTSKRDLVRALALVRRANVPILGVVVNQARRYDIPYLRSRYRRYYRAPELAVAGDSPRRRPPVRRERP